MALTEKQVKLDENKWYRSEEAGHDMCGEFDFCANCDKQQENPCAKAFEAMMKSKKLTSAAAKPAAKKTSAKKTTAVKAATATKTESAPKTTAAKKPASEKKPAAKKKA